MPAVLESDQLDEIPSLDPDKVCHIVCGSWHYGYEETYCGARYDCVPPPNAMIYSGQEVCSDCGRPICPDCARA